MLGRNGAGKSTLLQLAAGVLRPAAAAVRRPPAARRLGAGAVPGRPAVHAPGLPARAWPDAACRPATRAVDHWVDRLGGPVPRRPAAELSKGTAQKVGLAQALLRTPGLLVLDEPWEGLDAATRDLVPEMIAEVLAAAARSWSATTAARPSGCPGGTVGTVAAGTGAAPAAAAARGGQRWSRWRRADARPGGGHRPALRDAGHRRAAGTRGGASDDRAGPDAARRLRPYRRALAPLLAGLVVLGVLYGGGQARPAEAYGVSAVVLFPVLAWQTKILLDVEPDVQRRLARVAVGAGRRESAAGLLAAALAAPVTVLRAGPAVAVRRGDRRRAPASRRLPGASLLGALGAPAGLLPAVALGAWPAGRSPAAPARGLRAGRRRGRALVLGLRLARALAGAAADGHRPGARRRSPGWRARAADRLGAGVDRRGRWPATAGCAATRAVIW